MIYFNELIIHLFSNFILKYIHFTSSRKQIPSINIYLYNFSNVNQWWVCSFKIFLKEKVGEIFFLCRYLQIWKTFSSMTYISKILYLIFSYENVKFCIAYVSIFLWCNAAFTLLHSNNFYKYILQPIPISEKIVS